MRKHVTLEALLAGATAGLLLWAAPSHAQTIFNPQWNLPNSNSTNPDTATGTDYLAQDGPGAPAWSSATYSGGEAGQVAAQSAAPQTTPGLGWYLSPAANPDFGYTNSGARDQFYSVEPISSGPPATGWSFWLQNFTQSGFASQVVSGITPGVTYQFNSLFSFQDGTGPGMGYNAVTLANQTEASPVSPNTGDMFSYLEIKFQNASGGNLAGGTQITEIPAGSVSTYVIASGPGAGSTPWLPYSTPALVAPAGAAQAELLIGWANGGLDGGTGGQSAFADDATLTSSVPEPASLSLLGLGGSALLMRRRRLAKTV